MHRLERLINLVAALLDSERPLTIEELRPGFPGTPRATAPSAAPSSATRRRCGSSASPSCSSPSTPPTRAWRATGYPRSRITSATPGSSRRAGCPAPGRVGGADGGRQRGRGAVEARRGAGGGGSGAGGRRPPRCRPPGPAVRGHLRPPAGDVHLPRPAAPCRPAPPLVPHRPLVPGGLRPRRRRGPPVPPGPRRVGRRRPSRRTPSSRRPRRRPRPSRGRWATGDPVTARCWSTPTSRDGRWATWGPRGGGAAGRGSVVLAVRVTNRPAFRSFVLGFLDHAEVLGPARAAGRHGLLARGRSAQAERRRPAPAAVAGPWVAARDGPGSTTCAPASTAARRSWSTTSRCCSSAGCTRTRPTC